MLHNLNIRTRLLGTAALAAAGFLALAGFTVYSGRHNTAALAAVYESSAHELLQLQRIDSNLREVRFRAAGVLLDLMPVQGSLNHLRETRTALDASWSDLRAAAFHFLSLIHI